MKQFTPEQIKDYRAYEKVRKSGKFNMFTPQARYAAGLTSERHLFVMKNYEALAAASIAEVNQHKTHA